MRFDLGSRFGTRLKGFNCFVACFCPPLSTSFDLNVSCVLAFGLLLLCTSARLHLLFNPSLSPIHLCLRFFCCPLSFTLSLSFSPSLSLSLFFSLSMFLCPHYFAISQRSLACLLANKKHITDLNLLQAIGSGPGQMQCI